MNRLAIRTEIQGAGFGSLALSADLARQNNWIDAAYLWVWNARDPEGVRINWSFAHVDQTTLAVVGGNKTPAMPAGFGGADWIEDDQGTPLKELEPEAFDRAFASMVAQGQTVPRAWAYKVVNRQVTLGPTPSLSATYRWSYSRRVTHFDNVLAITDGVMTADTDTPLWPDHHMILVYHATFLGFALNSNPAAVTAQGLRDDALQAMRADLEAEFAPAQTWGGGGYGGVGW